ncbi:MAG TPA: DUF3592 domain-containing protein [Solirubrobacteraceae bacterium]|nr:DUF3592 domain-containing protein [Solirubrobacteraceae bacterium]
MPSAAAPPSGSAIADPGTGRARTQYLRAGLATALVGGVAFLAMIFVVGAHLVQEQEQFDAGIQTAGVIVGAPGCCGGETRIAYTAVDGRSRHALEQLPETLGGYHAGQSVQVAYDPRDPSRLIPPPGSLPNAWAGPLVFGGLLGFLLLIGGLGAAVRARQWKALLAGSEWRPYRLTYVPMLWRFPGLVLVPEDESLPPLLLRLGAELKWRSLLLRTATGRTVWLAGNPNSHAVIALLPGPQLFTAMPLHRGNLARYESAAAKAREAHTLSPAERQAVIEKAYRRANLPILIVWAITALGTMWEPTLFAWLVLGGQSLLWGAALVRLRMVRDRELVPAPLTPAPPPPRALGVPDAR